MKVLYIAGQGRSGSTLLERMLGQLDCCVSVGELRLIWDRGFAENQLCGCEVPFNDCQFWASVLEEAFGGSEHVQLHDIRSLWRSVDGVRYIPQMILPWRTDGYRQRLDNYREFMGKLYLAIAQVSGKRIIIDSSKYAWYAFMLSTLPQIDPYLLHLVRDSRAVSFSWLRKKIRPEITWKDAFMDRYSPGKSALAWMYRNILAHSNLLANRKHVRIRYEDMVAHARETLTTILSTLGEEPQELMFIADDQLLLDTNHTVAGNPVRFQKGLIDLREDADWREDLQTRDKLLVTLITSPLLWSYGYDLSW